METPVPTETETETPTPTMTEEPTPSATATEEPTTTPTESPGFGVALAVVASLAVALLLARRREV